MSTWSSCSTKMFCPAAAQEKSRYMETEAVMEQMVLLVNMTSWRKHLESKLKERKELSNELKLQGRLRLFSTLLVKSILTWHSTYSRKVNYTCAGFVTLFTRKTVSTNNVINFNGEKNWNSNIISMIQFYYYCTYLFVLNPVFWQIVKLRQQTLSANYTLYKMWTARGDCFLN